MRVVKNIAAQGDFIIKRIESLPDGLAVAESVDDKYIIAHSETGHNHTVLERSCQLLIDQTNEFIVYLKVDTDAAIIEHERSFDTHEPLEVPAGIYEIRRQREYIPEGYRRAQD